MAAMGLESVNGDAVWVRATRWLLFLAIWSLFLFQNFVYWGIPTTWWASKIWSNVVMKDLDTKHLDRTEGKQLFTTMPMILIAILAPVYMALPKPKRTDADAAKESKPPSAAARIWNRILCANGPFGVLTVKEAFFCLYVLAVCVFILSKYMDRQMKRVYDNRKRYKHPIHELALDYISIYMGILSLPLTNFLFMPVARGSPLLRLIGLPFEHAIKFHRWLGFLVVFLVAGHGLGFYILFALQGNFWQMSFEWKDRRMNALHGGIAGLAGVIMAVSSLSYFRRRHFDLFFRLHHLYIVFVVLGAMHLGEWFWRYTVPGIFLFALDRFQRFLQSRRSASILSTRTMPDGTVQVEVLKTPQAIIHPLQVLFVNFPSISRWQWHAFSLGSHHSDSSSTFTFHVKNLGKWTEATCQSVSGQVNPLASPDFAMSKPGVGSPVKTSGCPFSSVKVEGFYGGQETFFLRYPALVLVAGGSGMVPLAPILRDLLHRHNAGDDVGLPSQVIIIFAVKTYAQLASLAEISPEQLCPGYASKLQIEVQAYVTREDESAKSDKLFPTTSIIPHADPKPMRPLVSNLGSGAQESFYLLTVFLGTFLCYYVTIAWFIDPYDDANNSARAVGHWKRGLAYTAALVVGVVLSSTLATAVCYYTNNLFAKARKAAPDGSVLLTEGVDLEDTLLQRATVTFQKRPAFDEIFTSVCERFAGTRIGVLSSGPESLNLSVAQQCRKRNGGLFDNDSCYLSFHSISFEL